MVLSFHFFPVHCCRYQLSQFGHNFGGLMLAAQIYLPTDFYSNFLILLRWIHYLAGITWIGLLYFFNLVGFPVMQELDPATRGKVMPSLMMRALWWFRWSALVTVIVGLAYWEPRSLRVRKRPAQALARLWPASF
jgi:hypothetical protein